jgi:N-acetylglucosamine transport system permease protein
MAVLDYFARGAKHLFLGVWAAIVIGPLLWVVITAFKTDREILTQPWALPQEWHADNFARAWDAANIGGYFANSVIVVVPSVLLTLVFSAAVSYVLARFEFRGRSLLNAFVLSGLLFPVFLALVPLFFLANSMGLTNTRLGLALIYAAYSISFTTLFLTNFFRTIPQELHDAATLDGAGEFRIFLTIMMPLAAPGLVTMGIFNFIGQWNQFILPFVLINDQQLFVLPQGMQYLMIEQQYDSDWSALFAAVTIVMVPTIVIYTVFQQRIQTALTSGALK